MYRADVLRSRLEGVSGSLVQHRLREHQDPLSSAANSAQRSAASEPGEELPPEARALIRAEYARMIRAWLDSSLPALDEKTPREAARTKRGRAKVDLLLRDMELLQADSLEFVAGELDAIRMELGLQSE